MRNILLFSLLILSYVFRVQAQTEAEKFKVSLEHMKSGDFEKASVYLEELCSKVPSNEEYFSNYSECLLALKRFEECEKIILKRLKKNPGDIFLNGMLGWTCFLAGKNEDAARLWNQMIEKKNNSRGEFAAVASFFRMKYLSEWEIKTYLYARAALRDKNIFGSELAYLYGLKKDFSSLGREYLNLLLQDRMTVEEIQTKLSVVLEQPEDYDAVEKEILLVMQEKSDYSSFPELLIALYLQRKNYMNALIQAKALDRLNREEGSRIYSIAQTAEKNKDFQVAFDSYDFILSKYPSSPYSERALFGKATASESLSLVNDAVDYAHLQEAVKFYSDFIERFAFSPDRETALYRKARLLAFYMGENRKATELLTELLNRVIPEYNKADARLLLGDIYLISHKSDEAKLSYTKVEETFRDAPLGYTAKLRLAKLYYFSGDFEAANAYLSILKRSTSTEISNDALQLNLFIQDNAGMDSSYAKIAAYARADLFVFRNEVDSAYLLLDSLYLSDPDHALSDDILWTQAKILIRKSSFVSALEKLAIITERFGTDILADDAFFRAAQIYDYNLSDKEKTEEYYRRFLLKFPGSVLATEARKRLRELRGDKM